MIYCSAGERLLKNTTLITVMLALLAAVSTSATAGSINTPVTSTTLDNGLKVLVQEDHSTDLVAVDVWINAGSINETIETNGVSHFIEHLLFKATEKRGPGQVDMEIESIGASLEAKTSKDWTHYFTVVARRYLDKSLDIMADVVAGPKFEPGDVEHERRVIADEIARKDSNPISVLQDLIYDTAYKSHSYRMSIEGSKASVSNITRETIIDFYNRFYIPENTTIVLVGDISQDDAVAAVKKAFAGLKKKPLPQESITQEPARAEQVRKTVKRNTKLAYLGIAFPAPSVKDRPDVYAMDLLMSYLGLGYQSWLSTELKDSQKLAVEVSSDFLTQRDPGLAILIVAAEPDKLAKTEESIFAKITDLRTNKMAEPDLARARRSLEGGFAFDIETFAGRASTLGFYEATDNFQFAQSYIENIRKVTPDDVLSLAKIYLDPNKAVVVTLGP